MAKNKKNKKAEDVVNKLIYDKELEALPKEKYEITHKGDETKIWSISTEVRTMEDALAKAEIDTDLFEVKECTVNSYHMPLKYLLLLNHHQFLDLKNKYCLYQF